MSDVIRIPRRFNGPPHSVNGGYACGVTALALSDGPAEVSLRMPPPLDRPLRLEVSDGHASLFHDNALVAEASHARLDLAPIPAVSFSEAEEATQAFDIEDYRLVNHFGGCFACGPDRTEGDGLRIFPGPVDRSEPVVAWPWIPSRGLHADNGTVDPVFLWAALDCPAGWAWMRDDFRGSLLVLGRMAMEIYRNPELEEKTVVAGWALDHQGRKYRSGSALWSAEGELLALSRSTWLALSDEQTRRFAGSDPQEVS